MRTLLTFLLMAFSACAQNVAVLTHGAAGTEEFSNGCPTNWPSAVVDIGASTNLPPQCVATNGWVIWTQDKLAQTKADLASLKEAFNAVWIEKNGPGRTWTSLEFTERLDKFAPGALDALDDAIANAGLPAEVRAQLRIARRRLLAAQEVNSKNDETVKFMAAAVALGILTQDQADHVLKDP